MLFMTSEDCEMVNEVNPLFRRRIHNAGIRHFKKLIHEQDKKWLVKYFGEGADEYPVNIACLMRNIVWQLRERILKGEKPPLTELVRTFWYMYIKPTLARADSLAEKVDQYAQLIDQLVFMVKDLELLRYNDIGFRDDNEAHRKVGANANVLLFAEKLGHQGFLTEIAEMYKVSTIALGGQPSVLNVEYFVDDLKKTKINLQRSFYLFSIVDFDTSGWIIRDAFLDDLAHYGIKNVKVFDLINPDVLTPDEVLMSRYPIPTPESMRTKNRQWLKEVQKRHYKNQKYLIEGEKLYGLESEAVSSKRLTEELKEVMVPIIGKDEEFLKLFELKQLNESIKALILHIIA
jgi:hypothetical protein